AFRGNSKGGKVTGKGKIKTGKLDFEYMYFVKELKYNLISMSQICDKKNSVIYTDTECVVLSPEFKIPDENQVVLRIPRHNNMYSIDLRNIIHPGGLTCLFAKALLDESNLWHRRLGHINFKTINKLMRGNLVRGLPLKIFENDNSCVACQKGKQHKASLVTDDYSRFSWVFFMATKDETSKILKNFITSIENQLDHKVKIIRCDNRTEFKNKEMNQFCEKQDIKREFSVARTPQQNGVAKRKNRTLIEAARTMLADSILPTTFWAKVVNTACYVQNRKDTEEEKDLRDDLERMIIQDKAAKAAYEAASSQENVNIVNSAADNTNKEGAEANTNNLELSQAVSPTPTTRTLIDLPKGKRAISTKWVYRNKKDEQGIVVKNKARLVAQGYTQEEGIDYDEVFAPVAKIEANKLFLAYASYMDFVVYRMDVKSAFLYGTIEEEVYVFQPPGFDDPEFPDKVYKVEKDLYGLHQAPRAWYETLSTYLIDNGFRRGIIDKTLFIKKDKFDILLV
ncbi:putative ribonuclease H-like domain-containing protein, partial [Tanacetum coccineum]